MSNAQTFVVLGAGQAGGWTARTLRDEGFAGKIVLVGEEPYPPYERPPLSKDALLGRSPVEATYLWTEDALIEIDVELRTGSRATAIDRTAKTVTLSDGETIAYDRLMIATGARVRTLDIPGADLPGVHYLRGIADTLALRDSMSRGGPVLVIGGGWIGLEVAAAARELNLGATVVELGDRLCARAISADLSMVLLDLHRGHGVDIRFGLHVDRLEGSGRVERAVLSDGSVVDAATVVIGVGVVPNVELADEAGLETDNGIVVDECGRTSDPDIFAAGDVTNHPNPVLGRRIRLESWENAQNQGIAAARAMLGGTDAYGDVPWFWSDQYDRNIQLVGLPLDWDEEVVRGDITGDSFVTFYLKDKKVVGSASVNNARDIRIAKRLMQMGKIVDPAKLVDPDIKLQRLLKD